MTNHIYNKGGSSLAHSRYIYMRIFLYFYWLYSHCILNRSYYSPWRINLETLQLLTCCKVDVRHTIRIHDSPRWGKHQKCQLHRYLPSATPLSASSAALLRPRPSGPTCPSGCPSPSYKPYPGRSPPNRRGSRASHCTYSEACTRQWGSSPSRTALANGRSGRIAGSAADPRSRARNRLPPPEARARRGSPCRRQTTPICRRMQLPTMPIACGLCRVSHDRMRAGWADKRHALLSSGKCETYSRQQLPRWCWWEALPSLAPGLRPPTNPSRSRDWCQGPWTKRLAQGRQRTAPSDAPRWCPSRSSPRGGRNGSDWLWRRRPSGGRPACMPGPWTASDPSTAKASSGPQIRDRKGPSRPTASLRSSMRGRARSRGW